VDARARSGSRPDTAVLSLDCRAESGAPTPLTETAGGDLQRTGAARHDRISKKMTACDLDHRHNERIMQLIARPIGTFPPLDLRPRLDGAFFLPRAAFHSAIRHGASLDHFIGGAHWRRIQPVIGS
jgi:hypothetical protein